MSLIEAPVDSLNENIELSVNDIFRVTLLEPNLGVSFASKQRRGTTYISNKQTIDDEMKVHLCIHPHEQH